MDLTKVNTALKCEIFDTQYQIGVLQEKLNSLMAVANKQMSSKEKPEETKEK